LTRRYIGRTSVRDALASSLVALEAAGVETPRLDAEVLLAHVLGVDRGRLISDPGRELDPSEAGRFRDLVTRRWREREPVAYLRGFKPFRHIELAVDPRVFVPGPDTEHVVEAALGLPPGARVVDVGTGSGAIALALKHERPDLRVAAVDASPDALAVARANGARLGLDVEWHEGDLLGPVAGAVDAVVSNPPYVATGDAPTLPPEVGRWEPALALFAGADGLDVIRRLVPQVRGRGARFLAMEVGQGQAAAVSELCGAAGFSAVAVVPDLAGIDRVVVARC
jgi:release factor glutamine methyltransferase